MDREMEAPSKDLSPDVLRRKIQCENFAFAVCDVRKCFLWVDEDEDEDECVFAGGIVSGMAGWRLSCR